MTNRRGLLRGLGLGALGTAAGALGIAAGARIEAPQERPSLPLPADPELAPTPDLNVTVGVAPDDPFLGWGARIQRQAGCDASCSTVRYSAIEGIVAIRHEGFPGPIVKLLEDDWFGDRAAPREMTAIQLLRRKHGVWSGKLDGDGKSHETELKQVNWFDPENDTPSAAAYRDYVRRSRSGRSPAAFDWDALYDQKLDTLRDAAAQLPSGRMISREEAGDLLT